jgi:hypothetical protein
VTIAKRSPSEATCANAADRGPGQIPRTAGEGGLTTGYTVFFTILSNAGWVVSDRFGIPYGEVRSRISQLRQEEARLGRLLVTDKLSEAAYDQLREEWSEKIQNAERILTDVERETTLYLDDLDAA